MDMETSTESDGSMAAPTAIPIPILINGQADQAMATSSSVASTASTNSMSTKSAMDTIIQLKMYNKPVDFWKRRYKDRPFRLKISSIDMDKRNSESLCEMFDGQESSNINDCLNDNSVIRIAIMKDGACTSTIQEQFGHLFDSEEFVQFTTTPVDQEKMVSVTRQLSV